jgi:hypothetical protein
MPVFVTEILLWQELDVMMYAGNHQNIVEFYGAVSAHPKPPTPKSHLNPGLTLNPQPRNKVPTAKPPT